MARTGLQPQLRKNTHKQRVEIAHRISNLVLDKYGKGVLAVFVYGSTSKKLDRPYSDLELIVVIRDRVEIPMKGIGLVWATLFIARAEIQCSPQKTSQLSTVILDHGSNRCQEEGTRTTPVPETSAYVAIPAQTGNISTTTASVLVQTRY